MRAEKGFETLERYTDLAGAPVPAGSAVLLECMSNLVANELYSPDGAGEHTLEAIERGIRHLIPQCEELIIVSNEVFSGGCDYEGDTLRYLRVLAQVNRMAAKEADTVYEVVCGVPVCHKGEETKR